MRMIISIKMGLLNNLENDKYLKAVPNLSHPLGTLNIMQRASAPEAPAAWAETLHAVCGRAEAAAADLARRAGQRLSEPELDLLAGTVRRVDAMLASVKCGVSRQVREAQDKAAAGRVLRDRMGMTGREAAKVNKVSQALEEMPNTEAMMEAGRVTLDHALAAVNAAEGADLQTVDGDRQLLEEAAASSPDRFRFLARQWRNDRSADRGEELLERQKEDRRAHLSWDDVKEMGVLYAEMDPVRYEQIHQAIEKHADKLWRADIRGDAPAEEVRTVRQRRVDALFELITGRDALSLQPLPGGKARAETTLVVLADLGLLDGTNPGGSAEILDAGPVPPGVLAQLTPDAELRGMIFGGNGQPLWLGRSRRIANDHQRLAAAVRDRGCVLCPKPSYQTEMHHLRDWTADRGTTDIDNLVSLCGPDHRRLQKYNLQLTKDGNGRWTTRPKPGNPTPPPPARLGRAGNGNSRNNLQRSSGGGVRRAGSPAASAPAIMRVPLPADVEDGITRRDNPPTSALPGAASPTAAYAGRLPAVWPSPRRQPPARAGPDP